jgi:hypothetical protein
MTKLHRLLHCLAAAASAAVGAQAVAGCSCLEATGHSIDANRRLRPLQQQNEEGSLLRASSVRKKRQLLCKQQRQLLPLQGRG